MRLPTLVVVALLAASSAAAETPAAAPPVSAAPATLLVIDVQNFYFEGGALPLTGPIEAALKVKSLLAAFRARGWPVVHVLHLAKGQAQAHPADGDPQHQAHPSVLPLPGEPVIGKREANAFRDTDLLATLRALGTTRLVIVGMQTHMCVEAATRAASDLGFQVTVVHDACATRPLAFGGVEVPAAQVHAGALAAMASGYARVVSTEALLAALPPVATERPAAP